MAKQTRVSIETDSLLVLRGQSLLRSWCRQCGAETEMVALNELGVVSNLPPAEVQAWMESPELHHTRTADGSALICLNSMLKRVNRTGGGDRSQADLLHDQKQLTNIKGETMKHSNTIKALTIIAVFACALVAGSTANAAEKRCSNATLSGTYADQDTGTIVGVGLFAGVNLDSFDGKGNLTISGFSSVNGAVSQGTLTGTYTVNSDCTGTYKVEGGGFTTNAFFVIDDDGNQLRIVITDTGNVINCVARKQFPEHHD